LAITGHIDASDFKTMRDNMPLLAKIDIGSVNVDYYNGSAGTTTGFLLYYSNAIPQYAFYNKITLKSIILPISVSTIGDFAFCGCTGLTGTFNFPYSESYSVNGIGQGAFKYCSGLTGTLKIPTGVSTIKKDVFTGCTGITELIIPNSVYWIDSSPFSGCTSLKKIFSYINNLYSPGYYDQNFVNGFSTSSCILYVPIGKKSMYSAHTQWQKFTNIEEGVPPTVSTISISNISFIGAVINGVVTNIDTTNPTQYGVVWDTSLNPTVELTTKTMLTPATYGGLRFSSIITGLLPSTIYYARAYSTNSIGTTYGEEITFKTNTPKQLTISDPSIVTNKVADGNTSAIVTRLGTLQGVESADINNVTVTATANYDNPYIGTNKTITVVYMLNGSAKDKYFAPENFIITNAKISTNISISNPTVITNKMVDGNTNAIISQLGILQGVDAADANNVGVSATATYDNANVGINKTITVVYTLTGSAKDKYIAPSNYVITNAKISDYITLRPLSTPTPGCEGSAMHLDFRLLTGTPTRYKITFNSAALEAGMKNVVYQDVSNANAGGTLTFSVPNNTIDGTFQGKLKMENELYIESVDYPFTFTINVSADNIRTKFNDVVLFDNFSNRFTAYQWYKNGIEIAGATKQFYVDPSGLIGSYSLKLLTTTRDTLYTCSKVLNISSVKAQVSTFPNPVKETENCTVQLTGLNEKQLKDAKLSVYNMQGICVYKSEVLANENKFNIPANGAYVGHVTASGIDYVFKLIVEK